MPSSAKLPPWRSAGKNQVGVEFLETQYLRFEHFLAEFRKKDNIGASELEVFELLRLAIVRNIIAWADFE